MTEEEMAIQIAALRRQLFLVRELLLEITDPKQIEKNRVQALQLCRDIELTELAAAL